MAPFTGRGWRCVRPPRRGTGLGNSRDSRVLSGHYRCLYSRCRLLPSLPVLRQRGRDLDRDPLSATRRRTGRRRGTSRASSARMFGRQSFRSCTACEISGPARERMRRAASDDGSCCNPMSSPITEKLATRRVAAKTRRKKAAAAIVQVQLEPFYRGTPPELLRKHDQDGTENGL